jgi:hypothetical protein
MRSLIALLAVLAAAPAWAAAPDPHPAALVGAYDGNQMEMAAELYLGADGRFRYGLAYGAVDEEAEGTWVAEGDRVLLTSDPVTAPRFVFLGQKPAPAGRIQVTLETPQGMSAQYFEAALLYAHDRSDGGQLSDTGLSLPLVAGDPPIAVRLFLPVFELKGAPVTIDPAKGYGLRFRFEPNDLGKVDFRGKALPIEQGDLMLVRYDRTLRFRRHAE